MDTAAQIRQIEETLRSMNRCWTKTWDEPAFRDFIHPDAVAIVPTTPGRLEGRDAYVAGWRGFTETAKIHEWKETDYRVQLYNGERSAVATCLFSITFSMDGQVQTMRGRDMFFLIKEGQHWLVVADQFSPEPMAG